MSEIIKPYIITISSGKGGVGKSVLVSNLAEMLSKKLSSVLVWDAALHFPNQHLLFGVEPPVRLDMVYDGLLPVNQAVFKISDTLSLLADTPATGNSDRYNPEVFYKIYIELLNNSCYDLIIIDTPAAGGNETLQLCSFADLVAIVINDEPTSLIDGYGLIKLLLPLIEKERLALLVNNVIDWEDASDISRKLNLATDKFLGIDLDVLGFVPWDRIIRQSIVNQELFVCQDPGSDATKAIEKITDMLINRFNLLENKAILKN